ncbi:MAG TPA: ribokinase [Candidatus Acidoferrum sp.]|jgi:ribokinase
MKKRLVVVGSINLDLVSVAPRIPVRGETLTGASFASFPGGKGANQAYAAARLGTPVSMIGKLGNDSFGAELRANLESVGVDTTAIENESTSTGIAQIITAENGENVIVVIPGANAHVSPLYVEKHVNVIRKASIVLTQLEIPLETVEYLASVTRKEGIPLVLDPAPARLLPESLLQRVDWLTPNESETCSLLGLKSQDLPEEELQEVAETLLRRGSSNVLLKLGHRGCFLGLADGRRIHIPAYSVRAIDSTAAGDAFNGAFASAILEGHDPVRAASWASAVAAISVTRRGAQPSMPTNAEVQEFLREREGTKQAGQIGH